MSSSRQDILLAELHRKLRLFAWTTTFLQDLETLSRKHPELVEVETFPKPRDKRGFAVPPIGVARLRGPA